MLPTNGRQQPGMGEAERRVQPDRGGVAAVADDRDHQPIAARLAGGDERAQQCARHAAALCVGRHVDAVLDGEAVGGAGAVGAGIGVAQPATGVFGDQVGVARVEQHGAPAGHLGGVGRVVLEAGEAMAHPVAIDGGDGGNVGGLGRA
jgi:hypothetical protein